jgi:hypothetical protein
MAGLGLKKSPNKGPNIQVQHFDGPIVLKFNILMGRHYQHYDGSKFWNSGTWKST